MDLGAAQASLQGSRIDGWLVYDFWKMNAVLQEALGGEQMLTRRTFLWVPARGAAVLLASTVDLGRLKSPYEVRTYTSGEELRTQLALLLRGCSRVAMEYSPGGDVPVVSRVDKGTIELIESFGVEVVSSADAYQAAVATFSAEQLASHRLACAETTTLVLEAFAHVGATLRAGGTIDERGLAEWMMQRAQKAGFVIPYVPIVAEGPNSAIPHYGPAPTGSRPIRAGSWLLLDYDLKIPEPMAVPADITWVGYVGAEVPDEQQRVFVAVRDARDHGLQLLRQAAAKGTTLQGYEVDRSVRAFLNARDPTMGGHFLHRTGHSLGPRGHGSGANLDDYETHDVRPLVQGTAFSIEPGVYLPGRFGVRSEINVYLGPQGPEVTTPIQREVVCIDDGASIPTGPRS